MDHNAEIDVEGDLILKTSATFVHASGGGLVLCVSDSHGAVSFYNINML